MIAPSPSSKLEIILPCLVKVDDANITYKLRQQKFRIVLSQQFTTRLVTEIWNLLYFSEARAKVLTQHCAYVGGGDFYTSLIKDSFLYLANLVKTFGITKHTERMLNHSS